MVAPASTKPRKTKVAIDWYWDSSRSQWRFHPVDTVHRAEHAQVDAAGEALQPLRSFEMKGWVPAAMALQNIPESRKDVPDPVKQRYGAFLSDESKKD